jgi:hypothetical protein
MATTIFFEETIKDQGEKHQMDVELGRSSYYSAVPIPAGTGTDSIYLKVDDKIVIMDLATAKRFVEAVIAVGQYHRLVD